MYVTYDRPQSIATIASLNESDAAAKPEQPQEAPILKKTWSQSQYYRSICHNFLLVCKDRWFMAEDSVVALFKCGVPWI